MHSLLSLLIVLLLSGPVNADENTPTGGFPSSAPGGITGRVSDPPKSCQEYLSICERSCSDRDGLFRFSCIGPEYHPDRKRYICNCGDDAFTPLVYRSK